VTDVAVQHAGDLGATRELVDIRTASFILTKVDVERRELCDVLVASEVDFHSTYVGGSRRLIDGLPGDERIEALEVAVTDGVTD
jgi:hypothetical protein